MISVVDEEFPAHEDKAIVQCLQRFDVEKWNWQRFDICSEVIRDAAHQTVQHITLYSYGNRAVLKGWSTVGGFGDVRVFPEVSPSDFVHCIIINSNLWRVHVASSAQLLYIFVR